jgi:hypothetical protein
MRIAGAMANYTESYKIGVSRCGLKTERDVDSKVSVSDFVECTRQHGRVTKVTASENCPSAAVIHSKMSTGPQPPGLNHVMPRTLAARFCNR